MSSRPTRSFTTTSSCSAIGPVVVSDVWFHQGSALYPTPQNPQLRLPPSYSEGDLRFVDWPAYSLGDWTHVLIRTRPGAAEPAVPGSLALDAHQGGWWLYRTTSAKPGESATTLNRACASRGLFH